ncbi:MAG: hypothetical protein EA379_02300 [Phycisphaerales bacterium]|nr:MAG: hypothetical protein EA379_02300 [Phycisphaerales bacterium]
MPAPVKDVGFDPSVMMAGVRSEELLTKIAEHAREMPTPRDVLQLTMAAARYTLTSLESARDIAQVLREEIFERVEAASAERRESLGVLDPNPDREQIADSLAG